MLNNSVQHWFEMQYYAASHVPPLDLLESLVKVISHCKIKELILYDDDVKLHWPTRSPY